MPFVNLLLILNYISSMVLRIFNTTQIQHSTLRYPPRITPVPPCTQPLPHHSGYQSRRRIATHQMGRRVPIKFIETRANTSTWADQISPSPRPRRTEPSRPRLSDGDPPPPLRSPPWLRPPAGGTLRGWAGDYRVG